MPDAPEIIRGWPRSHPLTWQRVLLAEFEKRADLKLHIIVLRKRIKADVFFQRNGVSFHVVKVPRVVRAAALFWVDTLLIRPVLKTIRPDLVHAWGTERGGALTASRLAYPYLVTLQ